MKLVQQLNGERYVSFEVFPEVACSSRMSGDWRFLMSDDAIATVLKFEQLINTQKADAVCSLLTEDCIFIDSIGNRIEGLQRLRSAWEGYFKMVPDYTISHEEIFANGNTVGMFGTAQGTNSKDGTIRKENFWKTPAAWKARLKNGRIAFWQVFADNEPIRALMRKNSG